MLSKVLVFIKFKLIIYLIFTPILYNILDYFGTVFRPLSSFPHIIKINMANIRKKSNKILYLYPLTILTKQGKMIRLI